MAAIATLKSAVTKAEPAVNPCPSGDLCTLIVTNQIYEDQFRSPSHFLLEFRTFSQQAVNSPSK